MREYALNRADAAGGVGSSLPALFHNWQARRRITSLAQLSDGVLQSLGLTRADVAWALRLPLSHDPHLALEDRAFRRARGLLPGGAIRFAQQDPVIPAKAGTHFSIDALLKGWSERKDGSRPLPG